MERRLHKHEFIQHNVPICLSSLANDFSAVYTSGRPRVRNALRTSARMKPSSRHKHDSDSPLNVHTHWLEWWRGRRGRHSGGRRARRLVSWGRGELRENGAAPKRAHWRRGRFYTEVPSCTWVHEVAAGKSAHRERGAVQTVCALRSVSGGRHARARRCRPAQPHSTTSTRDRAGFVATEGRADVAVKRNPVTQSEERRTRAVAHVAGSSGHRATHLHYMDARLHCADRVKTHADVAKSRTIANMLSFKTIS